jgi:hypothetical protein
MLPLGKRGFDLGPLAFHLGLWVPSANSREFADVNRAHETKCESPEGVTMGSSSRKPRPGLLQTRTMSPDPPREFRSAAALSWNSTKVAIEDRLSTVTSSALNCLIAHRSETIRKHFEYTSRGFHVSARFDVVLDLGGDDQHFVVRHLFRRPSGSACSYDSETLDRRSNLSIARWASTR